ncbi:MAG: hypothetical protein IJR49_02940, partial [Treponema sp.]|nr:hypothetical protein [Treponema sp.]
TNQNFRIARKVQWRKFFTKKENQSLLPFYSSKKNIPLINEKIKKSKKKRFVCSNFIAYILYNSVENVKNFFDKNGIDFRYLTVTDIASIPGMTALFSSSWESFRECASIFLQENPIFARPYSYKNSKLESTD